MSTEPLEMRITIDEDPSSNPNQRAYTVSVLGQPDDKSTLMDFPFSDEELKSQIEKFEHALFLPRWRFHQKVNFDDAIIKNFGIQLFKALFSNREVSISYERYQTSSREQQRPFRCSLNIKPAQLATLPWESLYDPNRGYICLQRNGSIVRYMDSVHPGRELRTVKPPLRILAMIANPHISGLAYLNVNREKEGLEDAVRELRNRGLVELEWVDGETWEALSQKLHEAEWHILHFIGHAGYSSEYKGGVIVLGDKSGKQQIFTADQLANTLSKHDSLRLVILNACETGRAGENNIYSSVAGRLVQLGIPAVLSMQHPISDEAAINFSQKFHNTLLQDYPIDIALASARLQISNDSGYSTEWVTPVMMMRDQHVRLFGLTPEQMEQEGNKYLIEKADKEERRRQQQKAEVQARNEAERQAEQQKLECVKQEGIEEERKRQKVKYDELKRQHVREMAEREREIRQEEQQTLQKTNTELIEGYERALAQLENKVRTEEQQKLRPKLVEIENHYQQALAECEGNARQLEQSRVLQEKGLNDRIDHLNHQLNALAEECKGTVQHGSQTVARAMFNWVSIAGGLLQQRQGNPLVKTKGVDPHNGGMVTVLPFCVAVYPVENWQYEVFVKATRHRCPRHWVNGQPQLGQERHPVVHVNWFDVAAFCQWAGVRLLTEIEFEFVAGGKDGFDFPWGNAQVGAKRANYGSQVGHTTPVDYYRQSGASLDGVIDLLGNVWEFVVSAEQAQPNGDIPVSRSATDLCVVRGGCFADSKHVIHRRSRNHTEAGTTSDVIGFRVVLPSG